MNLIFSKFAPLYSIALYLVVLESCDDIEALAQILLYVGGGTNQFYYQVHSNFT